jgi:hypothetical protein
MRTLHYFLLLICFIFSCQQEPTKLQSYKEAKWMVDIRKPRETVECLCDLLSELDNTNLSDSSYREIQSKIGALNLGLEFGVRAGFYTNQQILSEAIKLDCLL